MRRLGRQGLESSPLGLGCMGMSEFYGAAGEGQAIATIHRALELGVNFLDTADAYGSFTNELPAMKGCTAAQIALAWVLANGEDIVPIPGTTRVRNLEENVAALDVELTDEEPRDLEAVFPKGAAAGDRYADMSPVNR
jgi:aryl-alcohol dehydrogenase-like predicted oxidoreductase